MVSSGVLPSLTGAMEGENDDFQDTDITFVEVFCFLTFDVYLNLTATTKKMVVCLMLWKRMID